LQLPLKKKIAVALMFAVGSLYVSLYYLFWAWS
jgi:hypothetical protein